MNKYEEIKNRHQEEVNNFPFMFAFNDAQFAEGMKKWNLNPKKPADLKKIVSVGAGGYVRKSDVSAMHAMFDRHHAEMYAAMDADETGEGFIYDMFLSEMFNHEYALTGDNAEVLSACGVSVNRFNSEDKYGHAWILARDYCNENTRC